MARIYKPVGPSDNKAVAPGQEQKGGSKPPAPPKNDKKNSETGGQ